jgi:hypothetical protein
MMPAEIQLHLISDGFLKEVLATLRSIYDEDPEHITDDEHTDETLAETLKVWDDRLPRYLG